MFLSFFGREGLNVMASVTWGSSPVMDKARNESVSNVLSPSPTHASPFAGKG